MDGVVGPRLLHAGAEGEVVGQGHCQLIPLPSKSAQTWHLRCMMILMLGREA